MIRKIFVLGQLFYQIRESPRRRRTGSRPSPRGWPASRGPSWSVMDNLESGAALYASARSVCVRSEPMPQQVIPQHWVRSAAFGAQGPAQAADSAPASLQLATVRSAIPVVPRRRGIVAAVVVGVPLTRRGHERPPVPADPLRIHGVAALVLLAWEVPDSAPACGQDRDQAVKLQPSATWLPPLSTWLSACFSSGR